MISAKAICAAFRQAYDEQSKVISCTVAQVLEADYTLLLQFLNMLIECQED